MINKGGVSIPANVVVSAGAKSTQDSGELRLELKRVGAGRCSRPAIANLALADEVSCSGPCRLADIGSCTSEQGLLQALHFDECPSIFDTDPIGACMNSCGEQSGDIQNVSLEDSEFSNR